MGVIPVFYSKPQAAGYSLKINACKAVQDLIEKVSEYNRTCFEAVCGTVEVALGLLRTALKKKQVMPEIALQDPDFEFIRDDPRFSALMDEFSEDGEKGPE